MNNTTEIRLYYCIYCIILYYLLYSILYCLTLPCYNRFTRLSFEQKLPARGAHSRTDAGPDAGSQGAEALPRPTSTSTEQHKPGRRACTCPEQLMCPRRKLPSEAFTDSVLRYALLLAAGAPDHYKLGT